MQYSVLFPTYANKLGLDVHLFRSVSVKISTREVALPSYIQPAWWSSLRTETAAFAYKLEYATFCLEAWYHTAVIRGLVSGNGGSPRRKRQKVSLLSEENGVEKRKMKRSGRKPVQQQIEHINDAMGAIFACVLQVYSRLLAEYEYCRARKP